MTILPTQDQTKHSIKKYWVYKHLKRSTMKQVLFMMTTAFALMACGGGSGTATKTETAATATAPAASTGNSLSDNPDYKKGLALVAGSDCLTCHKIQMQTLKCWLQKL